MKHTSPKKQLSAAILIVLSQSISAQTGESDTFEGSAFDFLLQDIKISSQKKNTAENLQDVPLAITVISGEHIKAEHSLNLRDIGRDTPNANLASVGSVAGVANYVIRGTGTTAQSIPSSDPSVGVIMDGISYGTIFGVDTALFDIETIEVIRGPVGTLFGRNVTGGAVVMRSTRPGDEFEGRLTATAGTAKRRDLSLILGGPLNNQWGAKLAIKQTERDGYWDNLTTGEKHGDEETLLVRPSLTYQGNNFDITAIAEYGDIDADGGSNRTYWFDGNNINNAYKGNYSQQGLKGGNDIEWSSLSLESNWDLWGGQLTGVYGYRKLDHAFSFDVDGLQGTRLELWDGTELEQEQNSLELRWAGKLDHDISLTAGLYLFEQDYTYAEQRVLPNAMSLKGASSIDHSTAGIFAQSDIPLSEKFILTLGGRYTTEIKDAKIGVIGDPNATGNCATTAITLANNETSDCVSAYNDGERWNNFSPKVAISWFLNDDIMAYASYTRGFRSGGYDVRFSDLTFVTDPNNPKSTPGPYNEEVIDAYELGVKASFMDGRARLNSAAFINKYDDLQRLITYTNGGQETTNAATATISGIEIEGEFLLTPNLALNANLAYTDASYDDFDNKDKFTDKDVDSLKFMMVPEFTAHASLNYTMPLAKLGTLKWNLGYSFQDSTNSNAANTAGVDQYELWDASIDYLSPEGALQISLIGRNLKDDIHYDLGIDFSATGIATKSNWLIAPRTYAVELSYNF